MNKIKEILKKNKLITFAFLIILYFIFIYVLDINLFNSIDVNYALIGVIVIAIVVLATNYIVMNKYKKEKKVDYKKIIIAIIVIGLIVRTTYILYTSINERQHDVAGSAGHLGYIETLYETGNLPTSNNWQYYHQPLHYIIATGWLKVNDIFGVDMQTSEEGIQVLTAIYSSITMLLTYAILKELKIKDKYKIFVMIIAAIHPTFIILSGSINNDCLLVTLIFGAILYLIKWYKNSNWKNTVILALFTACTALTKISGAIIAVPILYVFIDKVIKEFFKQKKSKKVIKEYTLKALVFGIIALGLGLSYSIRNMKLFGQAIFYVPTPGSSLYCGDNSVLNRITIFTSEWKNVFCDPYKDCNMIAYLIKSSLFGEFSVEGCNVLAIIMTILNILIIIASLICLIKILIKQKRDNQIIVNMFAVYYVIQLIVYVYGNFQMQYGCSMDIRYIVPNITLGALFIAINMNDEKHPKINKIVSCLIILFAIFCIMFELTYMQGLNI